MSEEKKETGPGEKIADALEIATEVATGIIKDVTTKSEPTEDAILESYDNAKTASKEADELLKKGRKE